MAYQIDNREFMVNVPQATVILKDNVTCLIDGIAYVKVIDFKAVVYEVSDFLDNIRQRIQSSLRSTCGKLVLQEVFNNRENMTLNVSTALNQFFEENENCAKLKRFELNEVEPQMIDLTIGACAERNKYADIVKSEAEMEWMKVKAEGE